MTDKRVKVPEDDEIKRMVERFLGWRLPDDFRPDGGIQFEPYGNVGTPHEYKREPTGTNLFDATQAEAMIRFMFTEPEPEDPLADLVYEHPEVLKQSGVVGLLNHNDCVREAYKRGQQSATNIDSNGFDANELLSYLGNHPSASGLPLN